eukprot:IDg2169t1
MCYSKDLNRHLQAHTVQYGRMLVHFNVARRAVSPIVHTQRLPQHEEESPNVAVVDVLGSSLENAASSTARSISVRCSVCKLCLCLQQRTLYLPFVARCSSMLAVVALTHSP